MRLKTEDERIAAVRSHLNEGDYDIRGLVVMLHR